MFSRSTASWFGCVSTTCAPSTTHTVFRLPSTSSSSSSSLSSLLPSSFVSSTSTTCFHIPCRFLHNPIRIRGKGPSPRRRLRKDVLLSYQPKPAPMTVSPLPLITQPVIPYQPPAISVPLISLSSPSTAISTAHLHPDVFGLPVRRDIIQRVVEWQRAKLRQGTAKTLGRAEVSGSNRKPHPQKGTGRARASTKRAPHMRGGGVAHGKVLRDFSIDLPQKIRQLGIRMALSAKCQERNLWVMDGISLESHKTATLQACIAKWESKSILFIHGTDELDPNFALAARNIKVIDILPQMGANVMSLINHQTIILTQAAVNELVARLTAISSRSRIKYQVGTTGGGLEPTAVSDLLSLVRSKEAQQARQFPIRAYGYRPMITQATSSDEAQS